MSEYRERWSRLGGGAVVWSRTAGDGPQRVLPDGCTDLIWSDGEPAGELIVAGPDTRAHLAAAPPGTRYVGLRFAPGTGPAVLGVPAHELRNLRVPLAAIWPGAQVRRLSERVAAVAGGNAVGRALEEAARGRLRDTEPPDPVLGAVVAALSRGRSVAEAARSVGLGERRLHRRSLAAFGYGPKTLGRVLRLNRALDLARGGAPFAEVAAVSGYADQAHLAREVRALAGVPLGRLLAPPGAPGPPGESVESVESVGAVGSVGAVEPARPVREGAPVRRGEEARGPSQPGSGANRSTPLPSGSRTVA